MRILRASAMVAFLLFFCEGIALPNISWKFIPNSSIPEEEKISVSKRNISTKHYEVKFNRDGTFDYSDKAQYWVGECFYAKADYANAIAAFNKVLKYKKTSKADDSQLKLGLCYLRMGKNGMAADEFKRLINRYPASEYVPRAEKYLADIKR